MRAFASAPRAAAASRSTRRLAWRRRRRADPGRRGRRRRGLRWWRRSTPMATSTRCVPTSSRCARRRTVVVASVSAGATASRLQRARRAVPRRAAACVAARRVRRRGAQRTVPLTLDLPRAGVRAELRLAPRTSRRSATSRPAAVDGAFASSAARFTRDGALRGRQHARPVVGRARALALADGSEGVRRRGGDARRGDLAGGGQLRMNR